MCSKLNRANVLNFLFFLSKTFNFILPSWHEVLLFSVNCLLITSHPIRSTVQKASRLPVEFHSCPQGHSAYKEPRDQRNWQALGTQMTDLPTETCAVLIRLFFLLARSDILNIWPHGRVCFLKWSKIILSFLLHPLLVDLYTMHGAIISTVLSCEIIDQTSLSK